jgi:hypothetical protein
MSKGYLRAALGVLLFTTPVPGQTATAPNVTPLAASADTTSAQPNQAQSDREWLTAYMLAHQGYQLNHMDALEEKFNRMTPSQLHILREMYQMKHAADMQQAQRVLRAQQQAGALAIARDQRQQQLLDKDAEEQSQGAIMEQHRLDQMHREANINRLNNRYSPYGYGGFGGGYAPYYHPLWNPLTPY